MMDQLSPENTTRVPAEIHFRKGGGPLFFSVFFQGLDVLGVELLKSGEWLYGIYNGAAYCGYMHFGDLPSAAHPDILADVMPKDYNHVQNYVNRLHGKVRYYAGGMDKWFYIGELDKRKIIQRKK